MIPSKDETWLGKTRDNIAWAVTNFMLNHVATRWYRTMILGIIAIGMEEGSKGEES